MQSDPQMLVAQAHPLAWAVGHVVGGLVLMWIFALIWEAVIFKRVFDDPVIGKLTSAVAAWVSLFLVQMGIGVSLPGAFEDFNLIALAILCGLAFWSGVRLRERIRIEDEQV
jgi:hypothetical protein